MLRDKWHIKVAIKENKKHALVFGLNSRVSIALVLAFFGYRATVIPLMQTINHGTRGFIWNSDGLQGFVERFDIINFLRKTEKRGGKQWLEQS